MTGELATAFKSGAQRAGKVTEAWGADNFYCPNCSSSKLDWLRPGYPASDYLCPQCGFLYQLKSKKSPIGATIADGAYSAMMDAIRQDSLPSFFFLHYEITGRDAALRRPQDEWTSQRDVPTSEIWVVRNLLLVPHFAFPASAIIKRPALSAAARRAGWIGCNFDLRRIPADARIQIVQTIKPSAKGNTECLMIRQPDEVREQFKRIKPLKDMSVEQRGWALDVLNIVRRISAGRDAALRRPQDDQWTAQRSVPTNEFTNEDVYAFSRELEKLHPDNRHIKDKIRQKLQVLRDAKLIVHVSSGVWRLP